jgi:hypothetical protein
MWAVFEKSRTEVQQANKGNFRIECPDKRILV